MFFAKQFGKPVIGYRTDSRTPYGDIKDITQGIHQFVPMLCDHWLFFPTLQFKNNNNVNNFYECVTAKVSEAVDGLKHKINKNNKDSLSGQAK